MLIGISRKHPDYTAFKPQKRVQEPVEQHDNILAEGSSAKQLEVDEIYKPSSHVNPIFLSVDADTGKYYSASEVSDVVFRFVSGTVIDSYSTSSMFVKQEDSRFLTFQLISFSL